MKIKRFHIVILLYVIAITLTFIWYDWRLFTYS